MRIYRCSGSMYSTVPVRVTSSVLKEAMRKYLQNQEKHKVKKVAKKAEKSCASILTITDDHSSPAVPFSQYILICQTKTEIFYNSLTLPIAMVNLISSYLAMDLLPPAKRQDFMDTLSS